MGRLGLAKAMNDDDDAYRVEDALAAVDWDWTPIVAKAEPVLVGVATGAGEQALSGLGLFDPRVTEAMRADARTFAQGRAAELVGMHRHAGTLIPNPNPGWTIADATRDMLRSTVREALAEGWSAQETAKAVRESAAFGTTRAETIARTEIAIADVQGTITGWRASGLVAGKRFDAAPDCCDECQDLDGEIVGLDEEFRDGDPPVHPRCRCGITSVLNDEMPGDEGEQEEAE